MRGRTNGNSTTYSQEGPLPDFRAIEDNAAAYLTGRTEERTRNVAEELGIPFSSLAARVSAALAQQGKRAAVPMLQMRPTTPGESDLLQPEMALARGPRGLLPSAPSRGHRSTQSRLTPSVMADINHSLKLKHSINSIAKRHNVDWMTIKKIQLNGGTPPQLFKPVRKLNYIQRRNIAKAAATAIKHGSAIQAVADRYKVGWVTVQKYYLEFFKKPIPKRTAAKHTHAQRTAPAEKAMAAAG